jgi:uncharacterized Zn finger protein
MSTIPTIGEQDIRALVGEASFQRGQQYYRGGAIFEMRQQGMTLKARCEGSRSTAYRVEVIFNSKEIDSTDCSCPIGGYCKHVVALLLTWLHSPEEFTEQQDIDAVLEGRSKAELISLIKLMLRKEPELEWLLETTQPAGEKGHPTANPELYRRQVEAAFNHGGNDWDAAYGIADEVYSIKDIADDFAQRQDYASATTVYEQIVMGVIENVNSYQDDDGSLHGVIGTCVDELGECLQNVGQEDDKATREKIIRTLFEIYRFDADSGGIGIAGEAPGFLLEYTTDEEKETIAGWVRGSLSKITGTSWSDQFHRQGYGSFLLKLEAGKLDDEAYLRMCKETDRIHDMVNRLLDLGRVDEAVKEAEHVSDYDLLSMGDIFVQHRYEAIAEHMMRERSRHSEDTRLLEWLKKYYYARNDLVATLELAMELFRKQPPVLAYYQEIRGLAQRLGRWENIRPTLLAHLQQSQNIHLLIQIALDESEIDKAIELVKSRQKPESASSYGFGYSHAYGVGAIAIEVAKAAEEVRPRAAIEIYQQYSERLIGQRGRSSYQEACQYLLRVRDIYQKLGENETWTNYITKLRDSNRMLRALKEEMAAAKLI